MKNKIKAYFFLVLSGVFTLTALLSAGFILKENHTKVDGEVATLILYGVLAILFYILFKKHQKSPASETDPTLPSEKKMRTGTNLDKKPKENLEIPSSQREKMLALEFAGSKIHAPIIKQYHDAMFKHADMGDFSSAIKFYDLFKTYCYKEEGGKLYFQYHYEGTRNSKNPCFSCKDIWVKMMKG